MDPFFVYIKKKSYSSYNTFKNFKICEIFYKFFKNLNNHAWHMKDDIIYFFQDTSYKILKFEKYFEFRIYATTISTYRWIE